jgi:hypothetical protein
MTGTMKGSNFGADRISVIFFKGSLSRNCMLICRIDVGGRYEGSRTVSPCQ